MAHGTFVTAITCMDGRVQEPVSQYMKAVFNADYVDTITEPGPDRILAGGRADAVGSIRRRAEISVKVHGSGVIAIISHHDCTGNPVSKDEHLRELAGCMNVVASWGLPVRIVGLWVNEQWEVELVRDLPPR